MVRPVKSTSSKMMIVRPFDRELDVGRFDLGVGATVIEIVAVERDVDRAEFGILMSAVASAVRIFNTRSATVTPRV